jgi:hypothetical protein
MQIPVHAQVYRKNSTYPQNLRVAIKTGKRCRTINHLYMPIKANTMRLKYQACEVAYKPSKCKYQEIEKCRFSEKHCTKENIPMVVSPYCFSDNEK